DVFLLTDDRPNMLPVPDGLRAPGSRAAGLRLVKSEPASAQLLSDLRSDKRMGWVPQGHVWLSFLSLNARAGDLTYDLALNVRGGAPSPVDAGLSSREAPAAPSGGLGAFWALSVGILLIVAFVSA